MLFQSRQGYLSLHKVIILLLFINSGITNHLIAEKQSCLLFNQEQFGHLSGEKNMAQREVGKMPQAKTIVALSATTLQFTSSLLPNKVSLMIKLEVEEHLLQILLVTCNEKTIECDFFL